MAVRSRFIYNLLIYDLQFTQQILNLLMYYLRFLRFVGKPDECDVCCLCAVGLVQAISFSHLSLGLTKDLQDNLDDINDNVNSGEEVDKEEFEELYEDSVDVIDMMKQNLDKIEQHGMATTRILKAMEEMLKDRSGTRTSTDIGALCQQN